jgi:hypothetical protein
VRERGGIIIVGFLDVCVVFLSLKRKCIKARCRTIAEKKSLAYADIEGVS